MLVCRSVAPALVAAFGFEGDEVDAGADLGYGAVIDLDGGGCSGDFHAMGDVVVGGDSDVIGDLGGGGDERDRDGASGIAVVGDVNGDEGFPQADFAGVGVLNR